MHIVNHFHFSYCFHSRKKNCRKLVFKKRWLSASRLLVAHASVSGCVRVCFPYQVCNWIAVSGSYNVIRFTAVDLAAHIYTTLLLLHTNAHWKLKYSNRDDCVCAGVYASVCVYLCFGDKLSFDCQACADDSHKQRRKQTIGVVGRRDGADKVNDKWQVKSRSLSAFPSSSSSLCWIPSWLIKSDTAECARAPMWVSWEAEEHWGILTLKKTNIKKKREDKEALSASGYIK